MKEALCVVKMKVRVATSFCCPNVWASSKVCFTLRRKLKAEVKLKPV